MSADGNQIELDSVAEKSPFTRLMEEPTVPRTIDVLFRHRYTELTTDEIVEKTEFDEDGVERALEVINTVGVLDKEADGIIIDVDSDISEHIKLFRRSLLGHTEELAEITDA